MSINIREGDLLVVAGKEYPVKSCGEYTEFGSTPAFRKMATVEASTKRTPVAVGAIRGAPSQVLGSLWVTPLDPVDQELRAKVGVNSIHELLQTFAADSTGYVMLVLEDLKT